MVFFLLKTVANGSRIAAGTFPSIIQKCACSGGELFKPKSKTIFGKTDFLNHNIRLYNSAMAKPNVYVTKTLCDEAIDILKASCDLSIWPGQDPVPKDELMKSIADVEGLYCTLSDKIDKQVLDAGHKLKVIATMSVGYDHLDVLEIKKRGIRIGYTPGVLTDATAELTMALLLATSRRLFEANEEARTGGWKSWSPFWMCGPGLKGSTVGIVGFGKIGQDVARKIKSFNPKRTVYFNRSERAEAKEVGAEKVTFEELLTESDFVIVTVALVPETRNLFDEAAFRKMKPTAVFVNTSRGDVVDQQALVKALTEKTIWAAGLDVMTPEPLPVDHPLLKLKNCVILPHIGSASIQTRTEMAVLTANNVLAGLRGDKMPSELAL